MRFEMTGSRSGFGDKPYRWSDVADLLDEIRSPQRDEVEDAVVAAGGDEVDPVTVSRIAEAVMTLYRRRPLHD